MPNSKKTTVVHATNVIIACVTKLSIGFRNFLEINGITEGPFIDELRNMELVLPTLLMLRNERISDTEVSQLMGKTHTPITDNSPPVSALPPGQAAEQFLLTPEV